MTKPLDVSGTYSGIERDDYPTFASIKIPFGEKHLLVPAFRFADGSVSRAMLTEKEWKALSSETRTRLTIDPSLVLEEPR